MKRLVDAKSYSPIPENATYAHTLTSIVTGPRKYGEFSDPGRLTKHLATLRHLYVNPAASFDIANYKKLDKQRKDSFDRSAGIGLVEAEQNIGLSALFTLFHPDARNLFTATPETEIHPDSRVVTPQLQEMLDIVQGWDEQTKRYLLYQAAGRQIAQIETGLGDYMFLWPLRRGTDKQERAQMNIDTLSKHRQQLLQLQEDLTAVE